MALTSRMILGFAAASKASSFTLKTVFSLGFSYTFRTSRRSFPDRIYMIQ